MELQLFEIVLSLRFSIEEIFFSLRAHGEVSFKKLIKALLCP
jgi:hypothetical protein